MQVNMGESQYSGAKVSSASTHVFVRGKITVKAYEIDSHYYLSISGDGADLTLSTERGHHINELCHVIGEAGRVLADCEEKKRQLDLDVANLGLNLNLVGALA